jgi:CubicO group peptidase (beta-lactamase class C family)
MSQDRRVRVYPSAAVTRVFPEEDPRDVGLTRATIDAIWRAVVGYYETGLQPAMSLCIRRRGRIVLHRSIGHTHGNGPDDPEDAPKRVCTPDSEFNLFSASKAITAMIVHELDDRGLLHLDDPVEEYIPEFGRYGKAKVTIRHILTHRSGIPKIPGGHVDLDLLKDPQRIVSILCEAHPTTRAGRQLAYHALTGGWLLGEICRRVSGKDLQTLLDEIVRQPMGMRGFRFGVPQDRIGEVAEEVFTGPESGVIGRWLARRALGVTFKEAVTVVNDPRFLTSVVPAGNLIANSEETCRFFEMLRQGGVWEGKRIFGQRTVRRAISETSWGEPDAILVLPVRYGIGFMLGAKVWSFYGPFTPSVFGHLGFTNVLGWADPDRELSASLLCNGNPFLTPELLKWQWILATIATRVPRSGREVAAAG